VPVGDNFYAALNSAVFSDGPEQLSWIGEDASGNQLIRFWKPDTDIDRRSQLWNAGFII
jgi:hypothetical protein